MPVSARSQRRPVTGHDGPEGPHPLYALIGRLPVSSSIIKRLYRHISQSVCPWNVKFSQELAEDSPFRAREFIAGKDARSLARGLLAMSQEEFSAAFKGSPIKRAKLRSVKRNAAVVLGNVGNTDDIDLLTRAAHVAEPLMRDQAAWALAHLPSPRRQAAARPSQDAVTDSIVPAMSSRRASLSVRPLRSAPDAGLSAVGTPG